MLASVIEAPRTARLHEVERPSPGAAQVLVAMQGCGVCASSIPVWQGRTWFSYPLAPGEPGHEGWGRIEALGPGVQDLAVGQRVAVLSQRAHAQFDVADASAVVPLPEALGDGAFPGEPLGCAMNIFERSDIRAGQTVAIVGAGFLGALLTQLAVHAGARVIAVSRRPFALDVARQAGAHHLVSMADAGAAERTVAALTAGAGCERVIEAVGLQAALDLASQLVAERGRLVIAGYHQDGLRHVNMQQWNWRGIDVINAHERDPARYIEGMRSAVARVTEGALTPSRFLTHRFGLDDLSHALAMADERPDGFLKGWVQA